MAFVPTFTNTYPIVGGSADTWGATLNARLGEAYTDFNALATQYNITQTLAVGALPLSGGTLTGNVVVGDPTPAGPDSIGLRGLPMASTASDYMFVAKDAGKCLRLTGSTNRTWTIPPNVLQVGQAIVLRNFGTANLVIARGAGVQLRLAGSATDGDRTIAASGVATIVQEDTNVWYVSGVGVS